MGFGTELQGKSSHEDLVQLQDTEIRLLESLKKCISQRIKCDRDYAGALSTVITSAQRFDSSGLKNSPVYQAWNTVVKETENMVNVIRSNSDKLCAKTLEKVVQLINEKKHTRKVYSEERNKLEAEYKKLHEDVSKLKLEYERHMSKVEQDKNKYKDICLKGKSNSSKIEEAKTKYLRSNMKLHRVHNDYVAAIEEATIHQKHYLRKVLPSMLDFQQDVQEALVLQCKEMLQEYAQLTDCSSENFAKSQKEIHRSINSIRPSAEYSEFLNDCRSDPLPSNKFEFGEDLLNNYEGTLIPSEIALDDMTLQTVLDSRSIYEDRLSASAEKKTSKENELKTIQEELAKLPPLEEMDEEKKIEYRSQTMTEKMLGKEITELECSENKYQLLYNLFDDPLTKLGDNDPPPALEIIDPEPFLVDIGNGSTISQESVGGHGGFGKKFTHLKNHIAAKIPFKRGASHPLKPPSRDDLATQNADETMDCLEPERQYSDDSYNLAIPKKRGPVSSSTSDNYQQCTFDENVAPSQMTLAPGRPLTEEEWFHGVLPREEVQRLLKIEGDYLLRESKNRATGKTQHVLSVMWKGYKHFIIQGQEGSWRFEGESFPTVQELILNQHKSGVPVTKRSEAILKVPIFREQWELRNDDIELGQKIGNGNFGDVFKGIYRPKSWEIAVKTCRETLSDDQKKKFLQEGRILKQYDHPNIVRFIGIAAQKQPVMIVMEYVPGGSLLNFLRKRASEQSKKQLVKICEDAAAGMAYLESKNCIHRDLAARNCLVGKLNTVKISDFGMSREEEEYVVSGGLKQIPIKWTAPEALNYGTYTSACDVWSFGILMWEVFSFGATPYSGLTNSQARERVDDGYRMPAPEDTPDAVYDLMLCCWEEDAKKRPRFEEMFRDLQKTRLSL